MLLLLFSLWKEFIFPSQRLLDKVSLRCAVGNKRSCNVAQKLGFTLEGHIRDDILINGKMLDANLYGLLREEF